ncbi:MAG: adenine nucleotide alpha hydrolase family protein [Deltaproteobacteria bacterium]|nr:adenine nucleotide alpha hydrolase family protein [Deltaproteobacteria bacterium]
MRCIKCGEKAIMELPRHNSAFCKPDYLEYFETQVERVIRRRRTFNRDDRILIGVSGGKDSLSLWHVLARMGYKTAGLHIHLGIGEYSSLSYEKTLRFSEQHGLTLFTVDLAGKYGMNVTELSRTLRRAPCSGCGLSKRYILNREAYERGFDALATGHNLDDETATLLGNILHWQIGHLARQSPVLPSTGEKLIKRVKPLYTLTERETAAYALLHGIDYILEECPNAWKAKSLLYKDALARIEAESPGAKQRFLTQFLEAAQARLQVGADDYVLRDCVRCGQPTTAELCAFCRMWQQATERAEKRKRYRETASGREMPTLQERF